MVRSTFREERPGGQIRVGGDPGTPSHFNTLFAEEFVAQSLIAGGAGI